MNECIFGMIFALHSGPGGVRSISMRLHCLEQGAF